MENKELVKLLTETAKLFAPKGPGGPKGPEGGKGPGGPPPEKKVLMFLNAALPEQPMPLVGMMSGLPGPAATKEIIQNLADQGLIDVKEEQDGEKTKRKLTITDAGRAKVEADREEFKQKMEAAKQAHKEKCDAKLDLLSEEEKNLLASLLQKIAEENES